MMLSNGGGGTEASPEVPLTVAGDSASIDDKFSVADNSTIATSKHSHTNDTKMIMMPPTANNTITNGAEYDYDPDVMERYVHFYKTGHEYINRESITETTTSKDSINDGILPGQGDNCSHSPPPNKKKQKRQSKKHISPIMLETRRTIQLCCRNNNLPLALHTFHVAVRNLIKLEAQVFYQLLNLCEGSFAEREGVVHVGTPKQRHSKKVNGNFNSMADANEKEDNDKISPPPSSSSSPETISKLPLQQCLYHADQIHALLTALHIPIIEQAYTALIRLASRARDFARATKYLDEAESTPQCKVKLRMYSSLLRAYCGEFDNEGNTATNVDAGCTELASVPVHLHQQDLRDRLIQALKVWKRMFDNSGGISTGHPNYHNAKQQQQLLVGDNANSETNPKLFGEGVSPKISLTESEYVALMKCATALHDAPLMERILGDLADMVLIPGVNTTECILNWFRSDRSYYSMTTTSNGASTSSSVLDKVALPPRDDSSVHLGSVTNDNGKGWIIYRHCTVVSTSTGELSLGPPECSVTVGDESIRQHGSYRLKPVELTNSAWAAMQEMNNSIVLEGTVEGNISQYQGGGKGKKRPRGSDGGSHWNATTCHHNARIHTNSSSSNNNNNNSQCRAIIWKQFERFIQEHLPYNFVIDGANVGYFEQNFANAPKHIDYKQIDGLLRHLLEQPSASSNDQQHQHRIILFLHERHFSPKLAPSWANAIFQLWDSDVSPYNRLTVFRTPTGFNDDWFWMHAALIHGGKDGMPSVQAITNDEMRDHHFQMLAQGSFLRWKERHQVRFDFGQWNTDLNRREVLLQYPSSYSRRIQQVECYDGEGDTSGVGDTFVIPLPKKGDERRFADGLHVAEEGVPKEEMYVVVQRVV